MKATLRAALVFAAAAMVLVAGTRLYYAWRYDSHLNHVAGVWIAMARDFQDGLLYRPLYSEEHGYGGTRYFPLQFVLHGILLRFGGDARLTGYVLAAATMGGLLAGLFVLLRRLTIPAGLAAVFCGFLLATRATQLPLLTVRGDALAAALYVWGLALCVGDDSLRRLGAAALLFTAAFAAKISAGYVVVAVVVSLFLSRRSSGAKILVVLSTLGFASVLLAMYVGTSGHVVSIMRETMLAGASQPHFANALLSFVSVAQAQDPAVDAFLMLGLMAMLMLRRSALAQVPPMLFVVAVAMTSVTLSSRATEYNHFVDLQLAVIILLAFTWTQQQRESQQVLLAAVAVVGIAALGPLWSSLVEEREHASDSLDQAVNFLKDTNKPILAENPLVSVLAGDRPYVLDPFALQLIASRHPGFDTAIVEQIRRRHFGAVVLIFDPRTSWAKEWYSANHFGPRVFSAIEENYVWRRQFGSLNILLPLPP